MVNRAAVKPNQDQSGVERAVSEHLVFLNDLHESLKVRLGEVLKENRRLKELLESCRQCSEARRIQIEVMNKELQKLNEQIVRQVIS